MNNPSSPFLVVEDLCVAYQKNVVLSDCSFTLQKGEILSLLGPSGCGKSTLLRAITGLTSIKKGTIRLAERTLASEHIDVPPARRGIGMIFQDYALFPHLTVKENILFGLRDKEQKIGATEKLQKTLALFRLEELQQRYPHQLSGGQQQRVAIARSLICEPDVLLFDEPFSNLDTQIRSDLMKEIKQLLREQKMTAIFVTHNKVEAFAMADKVAIMDDGKIVQFDAPKALYDCPVNADVADFLGSGVSIIGKETGNENDGTKGWQTDLGFINASQLTAGSIWANHLAPDNRTTIYLRPHQTTLSRATPDNSYPILAVSFQGDFQEYSIQLPSQVIQVLSIERFHVGEHVAVNLCLAENDGS